MARGRKMKRSRRRTEKPMIKVLPVLSGGLAADASTKLFFGVGLKEFFTGTDMQGQPATSGGSYGQAITLPELFGNVVANPGTPYGLGPNFESLPQAMMANIRQNFIPAGLQFAASAAIPKILTKTKVKLNANKLLKNFGLGGVVQL